MRFTTRCIVYSGVGDGCGFYIGVMVQGESLQGLRVFLSGWGNMLCCECVLGVLVDYCIVCDLSRHKVALWRGCCNNEGCAMFKNDRIRIWLRGWWVIEVLFDVAGGRDRQGR